MRETIRVFGDISGPCFLTSDALPSLDASGEFDRGCDTPNFCRSTGKLVVKELGRNLWLTRAASTTKCAQRNKKLRPSSTAQRSRKKVVSFQLSVVSCQCRDIAAKPHNSFNGKP